MTQAHNLQIFRVIPFVKLQNDTTAKWLKTILKNDEQQNNLFWGGVELFFSCPVLGRLF